MQINFFKSFVPKHHQQATFVSKFTRPKYATHSITASLQIGCYAYQAVISWSNPKGIF